MCRGILDAVPGCEAIFLDLHGAMVAENSDDGEGDLLAKVRAAAPGVPIAVALDLHGNVTQAMVENADVVEGARAISFGLNAPPSSGFGLMGMRERVLAAGGTLTLTHDPGLFVVAAELPLLREDS